MKPAQIKALQESRDVILQLMDALEKAQSAMWDAHYGNGIEATYARTVDETVYPALACARAHAHKLTDEAGT